MKTHTPLPWKVRTHPALGSFVEAKIDGKPYGQEILGDDYFPELDREADCAFVVRACNEYNADKAKIAALVAALELSVSRFEWLAKEKSQDGNLREWITVSLQEARAALAAAKE